MTYSAVYVTILPCMKPEYIEARANQTGHERRFPMPNFRLPRRTAMLVTLGLLTPVVLLGGSGCMSEFEARAHGVVATAEAQGATVVAKAQATATATLHEALASLTPTTSVINTDAYNPTTNIEPTAVITKSTKNGFVRRVLTGITDMWETEDPMLGFEIRVLFGLLTLVGLTYIVQGASRQSK